MTEARTRAERARELAAVYRVNAQEARGSAEAWSHAAQAMIEAAQAWEALDEREKAPAESP